MEAIAFQMEDVLELAIQMENTGSEFYRRAALASREPGQRIMLLGLSSMEQEHAAAFTRMKERLAEHQAAPSNGEANAVVSEFLSSWLKGEVFDVGTGEAVRLSESGDVAAVLRKAVEMEKEAISFYTGLRIYLASADTEGLVDRITREELQHIADLGKAIQGLK